MTTATLITVRHLLMQVLNKAITAHEFETAIGMSVWEAATVTLERQEV